MEYLVLAYLIGTAIIANAAWTRNTALRSLAIGALWPVSAFLAFRDRWR